jgi:hypothetical protein
MQPIAEVERKGSMLMFVKRGRALAASLVRTKQVKINLD